MTTICTHHPKRLGTNCSKYSMHAMALNLDQHLIHSHGLLIDVQKCSPAELYNNNNSLSLCRLHS